MLGETLPTRRNVLRAGSALLALPWLESLGGAAPGSANSASPAAPPKRLAVICTNFGLYGPAFFPAPAGRDYQPSEYTAVLGDLKPSFTVFSGISHPEIGGDHASESCFLTGAKHPNSPGFRNTVSLDYLAARHVGSATRFPLLSLSTQDGSALTHNLSGARLPGLDKPAEVYARLFAAGNAKSVEAEMARLRRGQSVLDKMGDRFAALEGQLSAHDRRQLADYTEAVRETEKQLAAEEEWVKRPKPKVDEPAPKDLPPRADLVGRARLMLKLAKLALQTDSTRVVSLFLRGQDLTTPIPGITENHHGLTHHGRNAGKIEQLKVVERAVMDAFREFLTGLRDAREGTGSLLDATQVLVGSNLGDASSHSTTNLPILLAGGGYQHGQHIAGNPKANTPLGKLYVSILQRFGVETNSFAGVTGTIDGLK